MPYPINGAPNTYNSVRNGAYVAMNEWVADPMAANGIRLYNDDGAGNIVVGVVPGRTGIECSSCHDVHNGPRVKGKLLVTGLLGGSDRRRGRLHLQPVPCEVEANVLPYRTLSRCTRPRQYFTGLSEVGKGAAYIGSLNSTGDIRQSAIASQVRSWRSTSDHRVLAYPGPWHRIDRS